MLGFDVAIYRLEEYEKTDFPALWDLAIAKWTVGLGGMRWLDQLVDEGKATIDGNGYPLWYKGKAEVILPFLVSGPPAGKSPMVIGEDYVTQPNWRGKVEVNQANMARCTPGDDLILVAWDKS